MNNKSFFFLFQYVFPYINPVDTFYFTSLPFVFIYLFVIKIDMTLKYQPLFFFLWMYHKTAAARGALVKYTNNKADESVSNPVA